MQCFLWEPKVTHRPLDLNIPSWFSCEWDVIGSLHV